jgi:glycine betaine/proline transport system substrate-binding protein
MTRTSTTFSGVLAAGALLLAACGSSSPAVTTLPAAPAETAAAPAASGNKPTIKIVQNSWTASAIEAEIAKQLIESKLGNKVEIVAIDENAMFAGMSSGELDAVMEIWPSGVDDKEKKFIDDGSVKKMGELGTIGQIGWFVPDYVIAEHPEAATWEGLKKPEIAKLFATAETGAKGRFLGTDPSFSQYDTSIVENLKLPFEVKFSGSEAATVAELDARVAAKEPVLMYWWTPTAAAGKYKLTNVKLPPHTDTCYADPKKTDCDYPADPLFKAASAKLETKDAAVFAFIQKFTLSNEDQLAVLPSVEIDKKSAKDVAATWIAANKDKVDAFFAK